MYSIVTQSDALQSEGDYVVDAFVLLLLFFVFLLKQESSLKGNKLLDKRGLKKKVDDEEEEAEQPQKKTAWLKKVKDVFPYLYIIFCVKAAFFFDREKSMNFAVAPALEAYRSYFQNNLEMKHMMSFVGIWWLFIFETFNINSKFKLSSKFVSKFLSPLLTLLVLA